jgi:hypothetical protein
MVAGNAYCFECGAPVGAVSMAAGPTMRMEDAGPPPRRKMSLGLKILIVVGVLVLASCGACIACFVYGVRRFPDIEIRAAEDSRKLVPPEVAALMPPDEQAFCKVMNDSATAATQAGGSNASTAQLEHLLQQRETALGTLQISNWVGSVMHMGQLGPTSENGDAGAAAGEVFLEIQIPCGPLFANGSGLGGGTGIPMGSPLATTALKTTRLETMRFTAEPVRSPDGHYRLNNLSPAARLLAPRFLVRFSALQPEETPRSTP